MFDLTSKESLKNVEFWLAEIEKYNSKLLRHASTTAKLILVGNKCDLHDKREVSEDQAMKFANDHKLEYIEASAFSAANVELVF